MAWGKEAAIKAFKVGANSTKGFFASRVNGALGGGWDTLKTTFNTAKDVVGEGSNECAPGIWGVIKNTSKAVWDTIGGKDRGLFRSPDGMTWGHLNPFNGESFANPWRWARRAAAGVTEIAAESVGGTIGIISGRVGNLTKGVLRGGSRMIGGVVVGDYGPYLGYEEAKIDSAAAASAAIAKTKAAGASAAAAVTPNAAPSNVRPMRRPQAAASNEVENAEEDGENPNQAAAA